MKGRHNPNKNILLTGGRGPAVLDLARQLHLAGHTLTMAESHHIHFCRYSNSIERHAIVPHPSQNEEGFITGLLDLIERHQIDVLIPGYDEGFIISKNKARFPDTVKVFVEETNTIDTLNNKYSFIQLLQSLGLNAPHSVLIHDADELKRVLQSGEFTLPCIVKSIYSAGGLMAKTVREDTSLDELELRYPCIAQKMIPGRVWSTYSVVHEGRMTFFVSYYPLYVTRENGAAICFKTEFNQGIFDVVKKLVEGTQYSGQIGFDIIEHPDGSLWPIECNPRITSGAHMSRCVDDFADCLLDSNMPLRMVPDNQKVQLSRLSMLRILSQPLHTDLKTWWRHFIQSKDVLFDPQDMLPALSMPLVGLLFFHQYIKYKKSAEENIFLNIDPSDLA